MFRIFKYPNLYSFIISLNNLDLNLNWHEVVCINILVWLVLDKKLNVYVRLYILQQFTFQREMMGSFFFNLLSRIIDEREDKQQSLLSLAYTHVLLTKHFTFLRFFFFFFLSSLFSSLKCWMPWRKRAKCFFILTRISFAF